VADGLEDLARRRGLGQLSQEFRDGSQPDDQVVAVIAVTEDRVESGQVARVTGDHPVTSVEAGPEIAGTGTLRRVDGRGGIGGWRRHGQSLQTSAAGRV
jgi:hypothetical protein